MTDAESLAAAAADECRRIIEEKDRLLTAARDERDAARDRAEAAERALSEARGHRDAMRLALEDLVSHLDVEGWRTYPVHGSVEGMRSGLLANARAAARAALPAPVPPGETTPVELAPWGRKPSGAADEAEALANFYPESAWCNAVPPDEPRPWCTRRRGHTGDHVAAGTGVIYGRWPAAPAAHPETTPERN